MNKIDLKKIYKSYYSAGQQPALIEIEKAKFISLEGIGDPSKEGFSESIQALYPTAYKLKFICKAKNQDFVVPKLEGLWHFDSDKYPDITMQEAPGKIPRDEWKYRLLIRMPLFVNEDIVKEAIEEIQKKKVIPNLKDIVFFEMNEGKSVQIMHLGPFEKEINSLRKMQLFMKENGLKQNGLHHEIYLSDFRKTSKDKLRTILREPVK